MPAAKRHTKIRRCLGAALAAAFICFPAAAKAECGMFFCWTEDDVFFDDEAHSGDPEQRPMWGDPSGEGEWMIDHVHGENHFTGDGLTNHHGYPSEEWVEHSAHEHYDCETGGGS